ncbi:MAG: hypothetical protein KGO02_02895 [Alphaproteobacteria bacterium]|nr:hypothetical protein [Alphaproteobacteria bacterium]
MVINDEGWIATADHIVDHWKNISEARQQVRDIQSKRAEIERDSALSNTQKRKALGNFIINKDAPDEISIWWGGLGQGASTPVAIAQFIRLPTVDAAVGKLYPFDPAWISGYPTIKDPNKDYAPGVGLCKLGFPLQQITPTWNVAKSAFEFPPDALPMPLFPVEGILTRFCDVVVPDAPPPPFRLAWIETSTPGLRGQSGGPIFDEQGTIWGMQVRTHSYPLGFKTGTSEQYLNVGLGVHAATLVGFLSDVGIKFKLSPY